ncbi:MAG: T9SS type A sorting domain-containing protein [Bacteroidales bacterium]|nr:T9SS type A sorting domain-containing protein [Bacteroidales bacterium]
MKKFTLLLSFMLFITIVTFSQTTRYVNAGSGSDSNTGTTWNTAFATLQAALDSSVAGDRVWVAAGTYKPSKKLAEADDDGNPTTDRDMTFVMKADVQVYGGFSGNEATVEQRNWESNLTILSGDIGIEGDSIDNCYHVVVSTGDVGNACLDGFTITGGNSYVSEYNTNYVNGVPTTVGGGICVKNSSPELTNLIISKNSSTRGGGINCDQSSSDLKNMVISGNMALNGGGIAIGLSSLTLTNITITGNTAICLGGGINNYSITSWNLPPSVLTNVTINGNTANESAGGMYNSYSSPVLTDVTITGNTAILFGGGMFNNNSSSPELTNVTINNNTAGRNGGGIHNTYSSSPVLSDVVISDNIAYQYGGGIFNKQQSSPVLTNVIISGNMALDSGGGGGIYNDGSSPVLTNVIISENMADPGGGGIANYNMSSPVLTNVTVSANMSTDKGGGIYNFGSSPVTRNSIVWGNMLLDESINNIENEDLVGGVPVYRYSLVGGEDIGNGIILNSDPLFVDAANGNYRLLDESPCLKAGSITYYDDASVPDLSGITTDIDGNPRFVDDYIDLGAYQSFYNSVNTLNSDKLKLYPNPVTDILYIEFPVEIEQINIYDINGVLHKQINNEQNMIFVKDLTAGVYVIKIITQDGNIINRKMIKK